MLNSLLSDNLTEVCEAAPESVVTLLRPFYSLEEQSPPCEALHLQATVPFVPGPLTLWNCLASF